MRFAVTIQCPSCDHSATQTYNGTNAENVFKWLRTKNLICKQCGNYGNIKSIYERYGADKIKNDNKIDNPKAKSINNSNEIRKTQKKSENKKPSSDKTLSSRRCGSCGRNIYAKRLESLPGTQRCAECARSQPGNASTRYVPEPWGTRKDWKRDRASWKRF